MSDLKREATLKEKDIFCSALEIEDKAEQKLFLDRSCQGDVSLRQRVERLLGLNEEAPAILDEGQYPFLQSEREELTKELVDNHEFINDLTHGSEVLQGYELIEELGRGSAGVVFKAVQKTLNRTVALKIILSPGLANEHERERFRIEAEAAARLNHPNIVPIYEIGQMGERDFYSMPFISGGTLGDLIKRTRLKLNDAVLFIVKIARAIQDAHQSGILHRDLTPNNILLDQNRQPLITDFGLACWLEDKNTLTPFGQIVGTPHYMAPEQAYGNQKKITTAADVYSLGSILYELATGNPVFRGENVVDTLKQLKHKDPVSPRDYNKSIDADLEAIIMTCLSKEPEHRYRSAAALADDLEAWLEHRPVAVRPLAGIARMRKWVKRHPVHFALSVSTSLLIGLLGIGGPIAAWNQMQLRRHAEDSRVVAELESARANTAFEIAQKGFKTNRRLFYYSNMNMAALASASPTVHPNPLQLLDPWMESKEGEEDLRGWEWRYLWSLFNQSIREVPGDGHAIVCMSLSTSQKFIALNKANSSRIFICDFATGETVRVLEGHESDVMQVEWSPDDTQLASASLDGTIAIWEVESSDMVMQKQAHHRGATTISWSPDGKYLVTGGRGPTVRIWDVTTAKQHKSIRTSMKRGTGIGQLSWSPDGNYIVGVEARLGASNALHVWSLGDEPIEHFMLKGHSDRLGARFCWSPDGSLLATGSRDKLVMLWNVKERKLVGTLTGHSGEVTALAWNAQGTRLASGSARNIRIWDVERQEVVDNLLGHRERVSALRWSGIEGMLVSADEGGTIKYWKPGISTVNQVFPAGESIYVLELSPQENELAMGTRSGNMRILNLDDKRFNDSLSHWTNREVAPIAFGWSPDGRYFAHAKTPHNMEIFDTVEARVVTHFKPTGVRPRDGFHALAWLPDGRSLVTLSANHAVELWDATTGEIRHMLSSPEPRQSRIHPLWRIDCSPSGEYVLLCGANLRIKCIRLSDGEIMFEHMGERSEDAYNCLTWSPDGAYFATGSTNGEIAIWNFELGTIERKLVGHTGFVHGIDWHPGGNRIASASADASIKIWDVHTGEPTTTFNDHLGEVMAVRWSQNGKKLFTGGHDETIRMWDASMAYQY